MSVDKNIDKNDISNWMKCPLCETKIKYKNFE